MDQGTALLTLSAASVGCIHTLIGPDHYVPFIALAKARSWSPGKTVAVTAACGAAHVLSAAALGAAAAWIGGAAARLPLIESVRGGLAAWLLAGFGFAYCVWGLRSAFRRRSPGHTRGRIPDGEQAASLAPWALFIVFVFGPCEPLIPLLAYPAASSSLPAAIAVTVAFGAGTVAVMLALVTVTSFGLAALPRFPFFERYGDAAAGGLICSCGLAMALLGW